jgi:hypothetical protein
MPAVMCRRLEFKWVLHKAAVNGRHLYPTFGASHCMTGISDVTHQRVKSINAVCSTYWNSVPHPTLLLMCCNDITYIRINWRYYLVDNYNELRNVDTVYQLWLTHFCTSISKMRIMNGAWNVFHFSLQIWLKYLLLWHVFSKLCSKCTQKCI